MRMMSRAWDITQAKINKLLDKIENPNEALDLTYEKMLGGLQEIKVHLADVVTEKKRIENKCQCAQNDAGKYQQQAEAAVAMGKDDLAREALALKQKKLQSIADMNQQLETMQGQVDSLKEAEQKFKRRVEKFRDEKEFTKAQYTAEKSVADVNESLSGLSDDFGGVGRAMQHAKDKTEQMKARSQAVNELTDEGVLSDPLDTQSTTEKQLDEVQMQKSIEDELLALKQKNN